jgi:hypothetical protein
MESQFTLAALVSQMEQVSPLGPFARRMLRPAGLPDVDVAGCCSHRSQPDDPAIRSVAQVDDAQSWNTRQTMAAVLGLVTDDPFQRDPSCVYPLPEPELRWRRYMIILCVALWAALALTYAAVHHG